MRLFLLRIVIAVLPIALIAFEALAQRRPP